MLKKVLSASRKLLILPILFGICSCSKSQTHPKPDKGILFVAFGTSIPRAKKSYENIDRIAKKEFKGIPIYWAYTSSFIKKKLARQGIETDSITQALNKMNRDGIRQVTVQSLHINNGSEYEKIIKDVEAFKSSFDSINIGMPLLISSTDLEKFSKALDTVVPAERTKDDAIILMGHGNHNGIGDLTFMAVANELNKKDNKIFLGTVEGKPTFDEMHEALKNAGIEKAFLIPMMVVAGDHAINDLAGPEEDSWKTMLENDGIKCVPVLRGLGENDEMVAIFVDHLKKAMTNKPK